ncbi:MAG: rod shape-determining protein MreD [Candidatus Nealsonbacteria bacterium]
MIKKSLFLIIFIYFLALFQISFLSQFNFWGIVPNYVLLFVIFINIFEKQEGIIGLISALLGGIFMDIFSFSSVYFFGFYTVIFLLIYLIMRFFLRNYVQVPIIKQI